MEKKFIVRFLILYVFMQAANMLLSGAAIKGGLVYYEPIEHYFNYIDKFRHVTLSASSWLSFYTGAQASLVGKYHLITPSGNGVHMVYSCIGMNIYIFWLSFIISYPLASRKKVLMIPLGLAIIFMLNVARITLLLKYTKYFNLGFLDAHFLYNLVVYGIMLILVVNVINMHDEKRKVSR